MKYGLPDEIIARRKLIKKGGRNYSHVPIACCNCGRERWLILRDARNAIANKVQCLSCHCHDIGKKGFQGMMRHFDFDRSKWLAKLAETQAANPSSSEIKALEILREILPQEFGIETQIIQEPHIIDIAITANNGETWVVFIEINGYWHRHSETKASRDRALLLTSLIPVEMVDDRILFTPDGQQQFATLVHKHLVQYKESQHEI